MAILPNYYPKPEMTPHTMELHTGTNRMAMQAGNYKQRRFWFEFPTYWQLTWKANTTFTQALVRWLNAFGYNFFGAMVVAPHNSSTYETPLKLMSLRLISDIQIVRVGHDLWSISATAEGEPSQAITRGF